LLHTFGWIVVLAVIGVTSWGLVGLVAGGAAGWLMGLLLTRKEKEVFDVRMRKELQPLVDRIFELEKKLAGLSNHGFQSTINAE